MKWNRTCFSIRFLIFYDEFLTLFELMLISLYNLRNANMKILFDIATNIFSSCNETWLIYEIMLKTIIKLEVDDENDKRFFNFQNDKRKFQRSINSHFFFFFSTKRFRTQTRKTNKKRQKYYDIRLRFSSTNAKTKWWIFANKILSVTRRIIINVFAYNTRNKYITYQYNL